MVVVMVVVVMRMKAGLCEDKVDNDRGSSILSEREMNFISSSYSYMHVEYMHVDVM